VAAPVTRPALTTRRLPANGGPRKVFVIVWPAVIRPFAQSSRSDATVDGTSAVRAVSARVSPMPRTRAATYRIGNESPPLTIATVKWPSVATRIAPTRSNTDRRSNRSTTLPACRPKIGHASVSIRVTPETSEGERVRSTARRGSANW
jgi:hypothetical protein